MGRKPKMIPHVPGTMDSIVESFFAKDKHLKKKKKEEPSKRNKKKDQTKSSQK